MKASIAVSFGSSDEERPFVLVHDSPLNSPDVGCTPQELRSIAATLLKIASDAEVKDNRRKGRSYLVRTD